MSNPGERSKPIVVVLSVLGVLLLLCCIGGGIASYLGAQRIEEAGGLEQGMRGLVADLAGDRDVAARAFLTMALGGDGESDPTRSFESTSPDFQRASSAEQYAELLHAIGNVMGTYESATIRNYNVQANLGSGKVHQLVYDAQFANGPAVVHVHLFESDGALLIQMFRVESPRFLSALAEDATEPARDDAR